MVPGVTETATPTIAELARCLDCEAPLRGRQCCARCGRPYETHDDIIAAIGPLQGRNQIVAAFYDGPGWSRFRKWERFFLMLQGGARRARMSILRHLSTLDVSAPRVLEVGIGDGENLRLLPVEWNVYGVDISRTQLAACRDRHPRMKGRLAWSEAEHLPFPDATFDACYSIGGFTYYDDHAAALREMRRVTRPGCPVVVADEAPGMHRAGIGHLIGLPRLDAFWLRGLGLDAGFVEMVLRYDVDLRKLTSQVWPDAARLPIWNRLGYCLIDPAPGTLPERTSSFPSRISA
jgi:SAM-dependent methyltransferase